MSKNTPNETSQSRKQKLQLIHSEWIPIICQKFPPNLSPPLPKLPELNPEILAQDFLYSERLNHLKFISSQKFDVIWETYWQNTQETGDGYGSGNNAKIFFDDFQNLRQFATWVLTSKSFEDQKKINNSSINSFLDKLNLESTNLSEMPEKKDNDPIFDNLFTFEKNTIPNEYKHAIMTEKVKEYISNQTLAKDITLKACNTSWYQTHDKVYIKLDLINAKTEEITFQEPNHLKVRCFCDGDRLICYGLNIKLYAAYDTKKSFYKKMTNCINIVITKLRKKNWKKLQFGAKLNYIKADWNNWKDFSDIESEDEGFNCGNSIQNPQGPDEMFTEKPKTADDLIEKKTLSDFLKTIGNKNTHKGEPRPRLVIPQDIRKERLTNLIGWCAPMYEKFQSQGVDAWEERPDIKERLEIMQLYMYIGFDDMWSNMWEANSKADYVDNFDINVYFDEFDQEVDLREWVISGMSKVSQIRNFTKESGTLDMVGKMGGVVCM